MTNAVYVPTHLGATQDQRWRVDPDCGVRGVYAVIATESALFVCLFASYYFLGSRQDRWQIHARPDLGYALSLLAILIASSFVLEWGERQVRAGKFGAARTALWLTVLLGLGFLVLQGFEYASRLKTLTPRTDSYGSSFYAITGFHTVHVVVGLLMLMFVGVLPNYGPSVRPPYRPYRVASLYWHFVDIVWIFVVTLLYVIPNLQGRMQ